MIEEVDFYKALGNRIKTIRNNKNISLESLSNEISVSVYVLSMIESGKVVKNELFTLYKICKVLNITFEDLIK